MAENKKSFILYCDTVDAIIKDLPNETKGHLLQLIVDYVMDRNPEPDDLILKIAFAPIRAQLKRDLRKWDDKREKKAMAGKLGGIKSGESRKCEANEANASSASKSKQNEANEAVNVNVNGNVNVAKANASGDIDKNQVIEYLRGATDRRYVTDTQIEQEAQELTEKYEGRKIPNLRALCNTWASNIKPWPKKGVVL